MFLDRMFRRRRAQPTLPNLLCVGVEKCGTTFLNAAFESCDSVLTPRKKELFFFNEFFDEGVDWYQGWYDFDSKPRARYVADITPSYFRDKKNLQRIRDLLPGVKVMVVLRHPVYRAFSHYVHRIRHVAPKLQRYDCSFEDILQKKDVYALLCPKYGAHMQRLLEYFPREDILLLTYENDILNPLNAQARLGEFLGLDDLDFSPLVGRRVNEGAMPRFYYAEREGHAITVGDRAYELPAGKLLLAHAKGTGVWEDIDPALAHANLAASRNWTSSLSSATVQRVYEEHFAADLQILQAEFAVDVDQWRTMDEAVDYADALPDTELLRELAA